METIKTTETHPQVPAKKGFLAIYSSENFLKFWPFMTVFIGGLIGGLFGSIAVAINHFILKSGMSRRSKIFLCYATGTLVITISLFVSVIVRLALE